MNYKKIYDNIISRAKSQNRNKKDQYYEIHHIIPRSLGGNNKKENLVLLTPKEHFICHRLLIEIYRTDHKSYISMLRAFILMSTKNPHQDQRYINSRIYEDVKKKLYGPNGILSGENGAFYNKTHSTETRLKLRESKLGEKNHRYGKEPWNKGRTKDDDIRIVKYTEKMLNSEYHKNRPEVSEETRKKMSSAAKRNGLGKHKTKEHKNSISAYRKEFCSTPEGKEEMIRRAAIAGDLLRGKKKEKVICPHCGKQGGKPVMIKHHFDNCKSKHEFDKGL